MNISFLMKNNLLGVNQLKYLKTKWTKELENVQKMIFACRAYTTKKNDFKFARYKMVKLLMQ